MSCCTSPIIRLACLLALAALFGCASSDGTIDGEVSYQGKLVESGFVSFLPKDGLSATTGGAIAHGKYHIANVQPGEKIARITITGSHPPIQGSGDLGKVAIPPPLIPSDAASNNKTVQISAGSQILDFHLAP